MNWPSCHDKAADLGRKATKQTNKQTNKMRRSNRKYRNVYIYAKKGLADLPPLLLLTYTSFYSVGAWIFVLGLLCTDILASHLYLNMKIIQPSYAYSAMSSQQLRYKQIRRRKNSLEAIKQYYSQSDKERTVFDSFHLKCISLQVERLVYISKLLQMYTFLI